MHQLLPDLSDKLQEYVDSLPDQEVVPMEPFASVVININACTAFHRDWNDWIICGVLPIADCVRGATVLHQYGVAIHGRSGDFLLFRSADTNHYNDHYVGRRASLVFHTDSAAKDWIKNCNGWINNDYYVA